MSLCCAPREIAQAASRGLEAIFRKGQRYLKCGVMLLDLTTDANRQLTLDETPQSDAERQRRQRLMSTIDQLNSELGRDTVSPGLLTSTAPEGSAGNDAHRTTQLAGMS